MSDPLQLINLISYHYHAFTPVVKKDYYSRYNGK